jgi:sucrose-6-phosphate hydrolase SacC (GH32 family)
MGWLRKGRVFSPADIPGRKGSHAQVPTPLLYPDRVRIFYADRNSSGKSFTTYVDLDRSNLNRVVYKHQDPILPFGAPGTFDDDGVMPSYALRRDGQVYLYYSGWNRGLTVPYRNSVGIAVSNDDGTTFERLYEGPVLERTPREPYIAVTPTIIQEEGLWRMWYISGIRWVEVEGRYEPVYVIKYASSKDGVTWERPNHTCVPQAHDREAFSHPSVIKHGDLYRMWYCYRSSEDYRDGAGAYRIGYAESPDGLAWERKDDLHGLPMSPQGWDSTMTCYPSVTSFDGRTVMFYNGNGFGATGFGYAILEDAR